MNQQKIKGSEKLKENGSFYAAAQALNQRAKIDTYLPPAIMGGLPKNTAPKIGFSLSEEVYREIQKKGKHQEVVNMRKRKIHNKDAPKKTVKQIVKQYSNERVTPQILKGLADWFCREFDFIYIEGGGLYIFDDGYFRLFTYAYARRFFVQVFREYDVNYALRSSDYKELVHQLQAQPQIMRRQDDCQTNVHIVLFEDGAFDARTGVMRKPKQEDYQFSKIFFPLKLGIWSEPSSEAREYVQRFCSYDSLLESYFWELIGYLFSGYQKKIIVVIVGPSNSGKSTLANFIRRLFGSDACIALGIKELSGSFNLAELQGKRLCIDSEMDASALNAKDISLLKKVVGNDLLQGNRKYEQQFYFQCQTKLLICSNNKIRLQSDEDTVSLFNRIKVFELKESIPLNEQRCDLDKILDENRTYFLQEAMKGLCRLVGNNFQFSVDMPAEKFVENVGCSSDVRGVRNFVDACCEFGEQYQATVIELYNAYKNITTDNELGQVSAKMFSSFLVRNYEVIRGRTSKNRFFKGIRLVTHDK